MELTGRIIAVLPLQTGQGRNGEWKKQEYVLEYNSESQFPRKVCFNLWGEKIDQFAIQEGQNLTVSFDIESREYQGRWYNDIRAWKVAASQLSSTPPVASNAPYVSPTWQASPSFSAEDVPPENQANDLPF